MTSSEILHQHNVVHAFFLLLYCLCLPSSPNFFFFFYCTNFTAIINFTLLVILLFPRAVVCVCLCLDRANFKTKVNRGFPLSPVFQVTTSARRESFVGKTLSVKTGILKPNANARAAMPPSTGILLTVKVGPYFTQLRLGCGSCDRLIISLNLGCWKLYGWQDVSGWVTVVF